MALRFRKSFKLAPGVRMNLSGGGLGWTVGPRGASIGIGKSGTYLNAGIPGTGLYARERLSGGVAPSRSGPAKTKVPFTLTVSINDEGALNFEDQQGNPVPESQIELAKKQQGDKIKALIQGKCDEINEQIEALGKFHEYTSPPKAHNFQAQKFDEAAPNQPVPKLPSFFCKFFKSCVAKKDKQNSRELERYNSQLEGWKQREVKFNQFQEQHKAFLDKLNAGDMASVEQHFEAVLQDIAWPQETLVAFEMPTNGKMVIDVDLPEIEDMPSKTASVPQRGYKLSVKDMSPTQVQKLYMKHVHAVGFRVLGEAFATSPTIEQVVLSAYSQRPNKAVGQITEEYLYSVSVSRSEWCSVNFDNLTQIDVVESLARFTLRRDMSKMGVFKPIEPFS
jgi:Protein of unknown function (DUF4236)